MAEHERPRPSTPPERTPDPSPDAARPDFDQHNVLAVLADMEEAREAVEALERAGIEANAISLLGRTAEAASEPTRERQRQGDEAVTSEAGRTAGKSAAAGAGIGGAAGFVAGAAVFGIPGIGQALAAGIWASTLGGAAAGAGVGFTAGGVAGVKESEAWGLSFKALSEGKVVVGVHGEHEDMVRRAAGVLEGFDPQQLDHFDVDGARRL